ncbi:MAG: small multi-drug export protein [Ruminococcaceae bacterium]|nr:small multi-drug export protein [Oscillospiraceae bacterium]
MVSAIETFLFETLGKELCVFICSMIPIIELRGAIPLGAGFGMGLFETYILSVIGNILPVPFILLFIRVVLDFMKKVKGLKKIALWVEAKADKHKGRIEKYAYVGLFLFVAIPLPGTGAWTGSLIAALMKMKFWKSFLWVVLGVLAAGVIMSVISFGIAGAVSFFA